MSASEIYINSLRTDGTSIEPWNPEHDEEIGNEESNIPRRSLTFNPRDWLPPIFNNNNNNNNWYEEDENSAIFPLSRMPPQDDSTIANSIREEIIGLEGTQNALLMQIRDLEIAHAQLQAARTELLQVLANLEENRNENSAREMLNSAHRRIIQRLEGQSFQHQDDALDDDEDSFDFYEEISSNRLGLGIIPSARQMQSFPRADHADDEPVEILEMFLDSNGEACIGFEDCLQRAVGWSEEKSDFLEYGIDKNGEEIQDPSTITLNEKNFESPLR